MCTQFLFYIQYIYFFHQWSPLHVAVAGVHVDRVRYLVDKNANINIRDRFGVSMQDCTTEGRLVLVIYPCSHPHISVVNQWQIKWHQCKIVHCSFCFIYIRIASWLSSFKATDAIVNSFIVKMMNTTSNPNLFIFLCQWTPLHVAVGVGDADIVRYLVHKEANINIKENGGVSVWEYTTDGRLVLLVWVCVSLIPRHQSKSSVFVHCFGNVTNLIANTLRATFVTGVFLSVRRLPCMLQLDEAIKT